jgi:hypothetical protein
MEHPPFCRLGIHRIHLALRRQLRLLLRSRCLGPHPRDLPQQHALSGCLHCRFDQLNVQLHHRSNDSRHARQYEVRDVYILCGFLCQRCDLRLVSGAGDEEQDLGGAGCLFRWRQIWDCREGLREDEQDRGELELGGERAPEDLREKEGSGLGSEHDEAFKV